MEVIAVFLAYAFGTGLMLALMVAAFYIPVWAIYKLFTKVFG